MIDFFSERIGVPYAYPRYSQITVAEFIFGGMENTTATTLTELVLLDERAALDHDVEGLVSHELAHQWWGDLLTCREWSEAWLNEGFATYFEYIWREHAKGRDEADLELLVDTDGYLTEAGRYQRPVVCRQYDEPIHLFDAHLYEKGGRVLHMLRHELGDAAFWRAIGHYARKHAHGSVETRDLARAIEEATRAQRRRDARPLDRAARPSRAGGALGVGRGSQDRDAARSRRSSRSRPRRRRSSSRRWCASRSTGASATSASASPRRRTPSSSTCPARPTQVIFDPGDVVLKSIKLEKSRGAVAAPAGGRAAGDRSRGGGARARPSSPIPAGIAAPGGGAARRRVLGRAGRGGARARPDPARRRARRAGRGDRRRAPARPPRRRRRRWASSCGDEAAARALADRLRGGDASYFVEAEAALALGRTRTPRRWRCCRRCSTGRRSRTSSAAAPSRGWAAAATSARSRSCAMPGAPARRGSRRRAIVAALAELARGTGIARAAREFIEARLADRDFRVRGEAAVALARLGIDRGDPPRCAARSAAELDGRARRRMEEAIRDLEAGHPPDRGGPPPARRGRAPARRDRQAARAPGSLAGASAPPPRRPRRPPAPKAKRPRPVTRRTRGSRPVRR